MKLRKCQDCNKILANRKAMRCNRCAAIIRFANLSERQLQSERVKKFWNKRDYDQLGRRAKRVRIIQEQAGKCLWCGISEQWNGKFLVFQIDHIDGDRSNNERTNLRALCPNCHSQTSTYCSRGVTGEILERIRIGARRGAFNANSTRTKTSKL